MPPLSFSIIIPTIGRFPALKNCLRSIRALNYRPERLEIIVVFDGCPPQELAYPGLLNVRILSQPQSGPAAARNYGAREAQGEYLAFTDDDCALAPGWLERVTAVFSQHPQSMVGGRTINALFHNPYASASQLLVDFLYEHHRYQFLTSNNMALSRASFLELGGFDSRFPHAAGEDREFCNRWVEGGGEIYYEPQAVVYHAHDLSLSGFWRQHIHYGRGAFRYHQKQAQEADGRMRLAGRLFYVNLLRFPFRQRQDGRSIVMFLLFLLMQFATAIGFLRERRRT
jgi:GT2 family glycosyltransferase